MERAEGRGRRREGGGEESIHFYISTSIYIYADPSPHAGG
jgi:hypothetical protein